jgi:hypothetical protein
MSKFNVSATRAAATSPIVSDRGPSGHTYEGAPGYARDAKSELFLLAVANMVGDDMFYERAGQRDERYEHLIAYVALEDRDWIVRFLGWLRSEADMRSASLEAARALLAVGVAGSRPIVASVLQRADEPGEALAYWTSRYGRANPKPVKRGIADAVARLYTEYAVLKYDTATKGFRFGDVIELVHPAPAADKPWQGQLFAAALDRRHGRADKGGRAGGRNSDMTRADVAKVFGAGLALRTAPTLVWYAQASGLVEVPAGGSLLKLVESMPPAGGGTLTATAVARWYAGHDRVVIVTDEQSWAGEYRDVTEAVPAHVPVYTWNLAGYRLGHGPSGLGTRHTFGGMTDAAFRLIPLIETTRSAGWPF